MANLIFLNHSGFLLELEQVILVFDMFTDPALVLSRYTESEKPVYFFVSHAHYDHWNTDILDFTHEGTRNFFLDATCELPEDFEQEDSDRFFQVYPGFSYQFTAKETQDTGLVEISAFASTDEGVSFLIKTQEGNVFHAGDLNLWDWVEDGEDLDMHSSYRAALEDISSHLAGESLWISMLPVDQRLGDKALLGAEVFLEYFNTEYLVPDHLNGGVDLPHKLAERQADKTHVLAFVAPGTSVALDSLS